MNPALLELQSRVERELAAHTEDDVLARSHQLKDRFPHIRTYPSIRRLHGEMDRYIASAGGLEVLDLGCGKGERCAQLLDHGARVTGIDISPVYVKLAEELALHGRHDPTRFHFAAMDAHNLQCADDTFDLVIGDGILHHLDLRVAIGELLRVLKPGGRAVFKEPLLDNPLLKIFRSFTPGARTADERPLSRRDLAEIAGQGKWRVESSYCGLIGAPVAVFTSLVLRRWPENVLLSIADHVEQSLLPFACFNSLHQYVLLNLVKLPPQQCVSAGAFPA